MASLKYRKEIDGLRALAVLPVILFHAGFDAFGGGYLGVDIFFVISGYLITSIILSDLQGDKFSIWRFYERRARRILPALITVTFATWVAGYVWYLPQQWQDLNETIAAVTLFGSNFLFARQSGYFSAGAEENPLLHTWSLAVEEQFYIFFPIVLMVIWRFRRDRLLTFLILTSLISLGFSEYAAQRWTNVNFYLLPSRIWQLMAGALLAIYTARNVAKDRAMKASKRTAGFYALSGLALIVVSMVFFTDRTPSPGLITVFPVLGTILILSFATDANFAGKILSWRPIVGIGLLSYSAYLWHQPVLAFYRLKFFHENNFMMAAMLGLVFLLSLLSYHIVEKPARFRWCKSFSAKAVVAGAGAVLVAIAGTGLFFRTAADITLPTSSSVNHAAYGGAGFKWRHKNQYAASHGGYLLYGDSHARHYLGAFAEFADRQKTPVEFVGQYSCLSYPGVVSLFRDTVREPCQRLVDELDKALEADNQRILVLAQLWDQKLVGKAKNTKREVASEANPEINQASLLAQGLASLIDRHNKTQIIIIGNVPGTRDLSGPIKHGYFRCRQYLDASCPESFDRSETGQEEINSRLKEIADRYDNVKFVDPYEALCDNQRCALLEGKNSIYFDEGHLTKLGAKIVLRHAGLI